MKSNFLSFEFLFACTLVAIHIQSAEPSFAYDFGFIARSSERQYSPLNSTTLQSAFRNVHVDSLDYYKQQLMQMHVQDRHATLSNIDFNALKVYLTPHLQTTRTYLNNHPGFNFFYMMSIGSFCMMLQDIEKKRPFQVVQSIEDMNHNIYDLYSKPLTWIFTYGLLGLMYYHYIYHQSPIVKTMTYLHDLENHYKFLTRS
jgi:hypothetical protein